MLVAPPSPPPLFSSSSITSSSSSSSSPSTFLILLLFISFAILLSVSFHLLRHLLSRRPPSSLPPPLPSSPQTQHTISPLSTPPPPHKTHTIFPTRSPDCAVCLSPLDPRDDLRLLPACRHAFHPCCIDVWLQSTPSCPLCRSPALPPQLLNPSFSFRHSVEHLAGDDEMDLVSRTEQSKDENSEIGEEEEEGEEVLEEEGWLREYLDRVASSASTSFNSFTFSEPVSSHRFDSGEIEPVDGRDNWSWDLEGAEWMEETGFAGIYRWFVGM